VENKFYLDNGVSNKQMSDLKHKNFYEEVMEHLDGIESMIEDHEFDVDNIDFDEEDETARAEQDDLVRFINHIRDAKTIAESY
jgi:hypothetical protein